MHWLALIGGVVISLAVPAAMAEPGPFSGWFRVELVSDSIWQHCELSAHIDEKGGGSQRVSCRSDEGKPRFQADQPLTPSEVARLRQLLRDADLFQGQFWGADLRGVDAAFMTLAVYDRTKAAVVVCYRNESFEKGARRDLLNWLGERMNAKQQREQGK